MDQLYGSSIMQKKYISEKNTNYQKSDKLKIKIVENGLVIPLEKSIKNDFSFYGGVYDYDMNLIDLSLNTRRSPPSFNYQYNEWYCGYNSDILNFKIKEESKTVVFLGAFHSHFGHFILESISRLWFFLEKNNKDLEYVFISENDINNEFLEFIRLFGLNITNINRVKSPTRYSKVIIPEMSIRLHDYFHLSYKKIIDKMIFNVPVESKKKVYYLSRQNIKNNRVFGEYLFELTFKILNIEFLYPENLSAIKLISKLQSSKKIIAISGTNSHNSIFIPDNATLVCLNRSPHFHPPQIMIDRMKKLKTLYIDIFLFRFGDWSTGPFFIYRSKYFVKWIYSEFEKKINNKITFAFISELMTYFIRVVKIIIANIIYKSKFK